MTAPAMDLSALADWDLDMLLAQASPALQETLRRYHSGSSTLHCSFNNYVNCDNYDG
jgi:hypothetical protein